MSLPQESRFVLPVRTIPSNPGLLAPMRRSGLKKSTKGKWYAPFGDSFSAKYKLLLDCGGVCGVPEYNKTYETWAVRVTINDPRERQGIAMLDDVCRELAAAGSEELKTSYPYTDMLEEGEIYLPITDAKIVDQHNEPLEMKDIEELRWQRLSVEIAFLSFKVNEKKDSTDRNAAINRRALFIQVNTKDGKAASAGINWWKSPEEAAAIDAEVLGTVTVPDEQTTKRARVESS